MAYPASPALPAEHNVLLKLFALFAGDHDRPRGHARSVIWLAVSAFQARDARRRRDRVRRSRRRPQPPQSASMAGAMPGMTATATGARGALASASFAGIAPANADALALAHEAYPATLPAAPPGEVANVRLDYSAHGRVDRSGDQVPGLDVRRHGARSRDPRPPGQTGRRDAPQQPADPALGRLPRRGGRAERRFLRRAARQVEAASASARSCRALHVPLRHRPGFVHIANGMYGAIIVEPKAMPPVDEQYVLVSSEWYLNSAGSDPASLDLTKASR